MENAYINHAKNMRRNFKIMWRKPEVVQEKNVAIKQSKKC